MTLKNPNSNITFEEKVRQFFICYNLTIQNINDFCQMHSNNKVFIVTFQKAQKESEDEEGVAQNIDKCQYISSSVMCPLFWISGLLRNYPTFLKIGLKVKIL